MSPTPPTSLRVVETGPAGGKSASDWVAPDCRGMNFWEVDGGVRDLLSLYMDPAELRHFAPEFARLGALAGGRLDELAEAADKHPPVLHARDRFGRDEDWIEYHPAYREMEKIAYADFGLHAMSHRGGVLGWHEPVSPLVKYVFQYLFVQGEFGLMCPVSVSDTSAFLIGRYGDEAVRGRFFERMTSQDPGMLLKGTQFMTERSGGSDVGNVELKAVRDGDHWRLWGDKWFCSHADADVALLLARPEGAPPGTRGLALFAMPRRLDDGSRNSYRIVRLKDKLGTRSMASGEIVFEGAVAYLVGDATEGLKQMLDQVNLSRLSHGVRAASMMRRCLNESMLVARHRVAFGGPIIERPLLRRALMKIMVPTEQALSMFCWTASVMGAARTDASAARALRLLTPLAKFRACRDNIRVATGAMEVRGGNGYIEDWVNARLVRDAHVGVLWEGTSNINALDAVMRAVGREHAHEALGAALHEQLSQADGVPAEFRLRLDSFLDRAIDFAVHVAQEPGNERLARMAASGLYNVASAILMTREAAHAASANGDARRLLLARMVTEHRLVARDPLTVRHDNWQERTIGLLLQEDPVPLRTAADLAVA